VVLRAVLASIRECGVGAASDGNLLLTNGTGAAMIVKRVIPINSQHYAVEVPDECPVCHRHSEVKFVCADRINEGSGVEAIFRCGFQACTVFFLCFYGPVPSEKLIAVRPLKPPEARFSELISHLSPEFICIYAEAAEVKHLGLRQVAGPGYRKAFEFLIKDYAKSLVTADFANREEKLKQIEKAFSGTVVNDSIPDGRIQAVATRCLWLGNDETHYLRTWTEHDLEDLVTLIELTIQWIEIDIRSRIYVNRAGSGQRQSLVWIGRDGKRLSEVGQPDDFGNVRLSRDGKVQLTSGGNPKYPTDWSPNGKYLLYTDIDPKTGPDVWALPLAGDNGGKPIPVAQGPFTERNGVFSPDGKWIAYDSYESSISAIYVQPFPPTGAKWMISNQGGLRPKWRGDGKELFFMGPVLDRIMGAGIRTVGAGIEADPPGVLFTVFTPGIVDSPFDVTADGQRFLVLQPPAAGPDPNSLTVLLNWQAGLKK
jgi:hypothetical protein